MQKRVLLDENLPQKLRLLLADHAVVTTAYQGWAGVSNGELLAAAENAGFDVMITADQGLNYQQNLKGLKLALVVLSTNKNSQLIQGTALIAAAIDAAQPGSFTFLDLGSEPAPI
jgi:predicted nuclease of predicted toxin-antitoxin system